MACEQDGVVWKKPANPLTRKSDDDVWDDRALIKAYDKAVAQLKGEVLSESSGSKHSYRSEGGKRKKKKKSKRSNKRSWKIGSRCLAVYSEDGLYYEATIVSINTEDETTLVHFDYYHNEEEVKTSQLLPVDKKNSLQTVSPTDYPESIGEKSQETTKKSKEKRVSGWQVSDICYAPTANGSYQQAVINSFSSATSCQLTFIKSRLRKTVKISQLKSTSDNTAEQDSRNYGWPLNSEFPPSRPSMFEPPSYPAFHSADSSYFGRGPTASRMSSIPLPPFPPPPVLTDDVIGGDEEALANMLMSWYMNGYHTGYYQGSKQAHRRDKPRECQAADASLLDSST